jgi:enoyl-CoA hydratase/carnithine racemase
MLLKRPRTGRLELEDNRHTNRRGPVFFQLQSDIWHIKYLVKPEHLQRRQMTRCGKETHFILLTRQGRMEAAMTASSTANDAEPLVVQRITNGVAFLTLNRPGQYNVLSEQMLAALHGALEGLAADASVRVVVLGAAGKAFCAGHDLKQMKSNPSLQYYQRLFDDCSRLMMRIQKLPQPVIARVQGMATAAGCQLVATCDLAIAADDARFAVSGVNVGLFCATPSVALTRNVGRKAAFEMLVTGEFIDAATAVQRGLINRSVAANCLDMEIDKLAAAIVAKPPTVIAMGKALFYRQMELGIAPAYQLAAQTMACNMMDDIAQEGVSAFIAKRSPNWTPTGL